MYVMIMYTRSLIDNNKDTCCYYWYMFISMLPYIGESLCDRNHETAYLILGQLLYIYYIHCVHFHTSCRKLAIYMKHTQKGLLNWTYCGQFSAYNFYLSYLLGIKITITSLHILMSSLHFYQHNHLTECTIVIT